jgi:hypothetical protein
MEEMLKMNLITSSVTQGLVRADLFMKLSDVSIGVYYKAKAKGDKAAMQQAAGYAADSMGSAVKSSKDAQKALKEAEKKAKEQAKAEQEETLEERCKKAAEDKKDQQEAVRERSRVDTVEVSEEGKVYIDSKDRAKSVEDAEKESESHKIIKDTAVQTYTSEGKINSLAADHKVSVTV